MCAVYLEKQTSEWKELFFQLLHLQIYNDELADDLHPRALNREEREKLINWDKLFSMAIQN